jgi:hypothetical protein
LLRFVAVLGQTEKRVLGVGWVVERVYCNDGIPAVLHLVRSQFNSGCVTASRAPSFVMWQLPGPG